ncbi:MAG: hypothetical protein HUJ24_00670 [Rhodobacteraceae bacterium]|nr:hypothetical protein [Paracoccaceae bacterium]
MLMLGNEYPVIWRVDAAPGAKIAGVLLNGYYPAMIEGLPDGVSVGRIAVEWLESSSPLESGRPYDCAPPDGLTADQAERLAAFVARGGIGWPLDAPNPTILEVLERAEQTLAVLGPLEVVSYQGSGQGTLNRMTGIFEFSATVSDATRGVFRHDGRELIPSESVMAARERTMQYLTPGPSGAPLCLPEIAGPADVHVLSSYDGGDKLDPSLARTTGYADVRVEPTETPVLLVLSSYEKVIWRIDAADDARIAGILLSGYHPPMIDGVPDDVSVGRIASKWAESLEDYVCEPNPTLSDERKVSLSQLLRTSNPTHVDDDELEDLVPILDFMGGFDVLYHQEGHNIPGLTFTVPAR